MDINKLKKDQEIDWNDGIHRGSDEWEQRDTEQKLLYQKMLEQFLGLMALNPDGSPIEGQEPNPGAAIMFFLTTMSEEILGKSGDKIDKDADQLTELSHLTDAANELRDIFNEAKGNPDPALVERFHRVEAEIRGRLETDPWLKDLAEPLTKSLDDIDLAIQSNGGSIANIWSKAGDTGGDIGPWVFFSKEITEWDDTYKNNKIVEERYHIPKEVYEERYKNFDPAHPDYYHQNFNFDYDEKTGEMVVSLKDKNLTPQEANTLWVKLKTAWEPMNIEPMKTAVDQYNRDHPIPEPSLQPNAVDSADLKKVLSALDSMGSSSSSFSSNLQAQLNLDTGEYNAWLNGLQDMMKKMIDQMAFFISKSN